VLNFPATDSNSHIPDGQIFPMDTRIVPAGVVDSQDMSYLKRTFKASFLRYGWHQFWIASAMCRTIWARPWSCPTLVTTGRIGAFAFAPRLRQPPEILPGQAQCEYDDV